MKTLIITSAALALLAAPATALAKDKDKHVYGHPGTPPGLAKKPYGMPPGQAKKMWRKGERLPVAYYQTPSYYIVEPARYRLPPAPPGQRWVLVEDRAYLADTRTGLIARVIADLLL